MTYMDTSSNPPAIRHDGDGASEREAREPLIIVVEDGAELSGSFHMICECLGISVERMSSSGDLGSVLRHRRPMAVVAEMDALGQDGCHVLKTIAAYDRSLPALLITGPNASLLGAVDAVEEVWNLTSVEKWQELLGVGALVDFLFRAGRKGCCIRLMSV